MVSAAGLALPRLLQLASPSLPVGGYAYSEGLEQAVEAGLVHDADSAGEWILGLLGHCVARLDAPLLVRMREAFDRGDDDTALALSRELLSCRETRELRDTDRWLGQALARVLVDLEQAGAKRWLRCPDATFAATFALACARLGIPAHEGVSAFMWAWCEHMVAAAVKLVPLGQRAGQALLFRAGTAIPGLAARALTLPEDDIGGGAPGLAIASARHETQTTRLFRS